MPWCPNCKNEYREGILKCADCGADLVAELSADEDKVILCYLVNEQNVEKLISYLDYSGIKSESEFDPDEAAYGVFVKEKDLKRAQVEYRAFRTVESSQSNRPKPVSDEENRNSADISDLSSDSPENDTEEEYEVIRINSIEDLNKLKAADLSDEQKESLLRQVAEKQAAAYKPAGVYQSQSDKASDFYSTGYTFLIIGIAIFIFTALNLFGVISLFHDNIMTLVVLFALSLAACGVGIGAFKRSKKASSQVAAEEKLTEDINDWMEKNISVMTDAYPDGEDIGEEELYLNRTAAMKSSLTRIFGQLDEDYIDSLIDDFYNKHF